MIRNHQYLLVLFAWLALCGLATCQTPDSIPGLVLSAEGPCASQSFVLDGPNFDPQSDSLAPVTALRSSGAESGKRLPSFLLPWTPIASGSSLYSARAVRTGKRASLHGSYQNGIEFWLGEDAALRLQSHFYPGTFAIESGLLWMKSYRRSVELQANDLTLKLEPGAAVLLRRGAEGEEFWVLEGEVEGNRERSLDPLPLHPEFSELPQLREGRFEEALALLQGGSWQDRVLGAAVDNALGHLEEALVVYREILEREPENQEIRFLQGVLLARQGKLKESLSTLERVDGPQAGYADAVRGYLLYQAGKRKQAIRLIDETLAEDQATPELVKATLITIRALCSENVERSVEVLSELYKRKPGDPYLANDLGVYLASQGRLKAALEYLIKARRTSRLNPYIRLNLSTLYILLGQQNRAQSELGLLELISPDSGVVKQSLGLNYGELGFGATSSRLIAQATALDPLLISPGRGEIVVNSSYIEGVDPSYFANITRRLGPAAVSLSLDSGFSDIGTVTNASVEAGAPVGKGGLTGLFTQRKGLAPGLGEVSGPGGLVVYQVPLGDKTRLWAAGSYETPSFEVEIPGVEGVEGRNTRLELRLDHRMSVRNSLSMGLGLGNDEFLINPDDPQSRQLVDQNVDRVWLQDAHLFGKRTLLTAGVGLDRLRGADSVLSPYLGLMVRADEDTTISLGVLRQSDIAQLGDPNQQGRFQLLERPMISSTTLFPIRDEERAFIRSNSGDNRSLPLWDYRLQLRRSFGPDYFGIVEAYRTEVFPSDIAGRRSDPILKNRPATSRSTLQGVRVEGDFQTHLAFGNFIYVYRDYRNADGSRWLLVPRHDLKGVFLFPLAAKTSLGLIPVYLDGLTDGTQEQSVGSLSAFVRVPVPGGNLNLGYSNLVSTNRNLAPGGPLLNLILKF